MLFADADQIYSFNYGEIEAKLAEKVTSHESGTKCPNLYTDYIFKFALQSNPDFLVMNKKQDIALIAAKEDVLMVDF